MGCLGELGRRRRGWKLEISDAAGGGVRVLLAPTNLSWKPISKRPIVYDSYGIPQGITTGTFELIKLSNNSSKPRYSPLISHPLQHSCLTTFNTSNFCWASLGALNQRNDSPYWLMKQHQRSKQRRPTLVAIVWQYIINLGEYYFLLLTPKATREKTIAVGRYHTNW